MFRVEWVHPGVRAAEEAEELFEDFMTSYAAGGPCEFTTLYWAARALENSYVVGRISGFPSGEVELWDSDVVDMLMSVEQALEALRSCGDGRLELYCQSAGKDIVVLGGAEEVELYLVPSFELLGVEGESLRERLSRSGFPRVSCGREYLIDHLGEVCSKFARAAVAVDPRLAGHEPVRRWLVGVGGME
ncbi:hypothetical protein [Glycomyces paridis]|uniref:Uncharacterized protein n=1 Tax=Glycomyces paridis TaxID=2126555 RepID=A0A4S8PDG6_9ACTN|nr:hypothetical protein [Glycomyces paridis]THV27232.1 hypothetical protein E9998_15320 [Glycomyces paridis]